MARFVTLILVSAVFSVGCDAADPMWSMPDTHNGALAPTPGEDAILRLLNDEGTTHPFLDHEVRLERRAATHLIERRNGPDGVYGTDDDHLFGSLAEVDAVPYVGPYALEQLRTYALAAGLGD